MHFAIHSLFTLLAFHSYFFYMDYTKLAKVLEENQYVPESLSFKNDWRGWKLAYDDALLSYHESEEDVVRNTAISVLDHPYKLVFRGSGNVFCNYIYAFVNEEPEELPFFMVNRSEIHNYYEDFSERIHLDEKECKILFQTDDRKYEFEQDEDFVEKHRDDVESIFLDEEFWELIYFGHFDPDPLTRVTDGWGRRSLSPSEEVPRVIL